MLIISDEQVMINHIFYACKACLTMEDIEVNHCDFRKAVHDFSVGLMTNHNIVNDIILIIICAKSIIVVYTNESHERVKLVYFMNLFICWTNNLKSTLSYDYSICREYIMKRIDQLLIHTELIIHCSEMDNKQVKILNEKIIYGTTIESNVLYVKTSQRNQYFKENQR